MTAGFTVLFAGAGLAQGQAGAVWGAVGLMGLFWIASAGLLLVGYVTGTRESAVAVVGDKVMVMQTGLRRAKRREWPRSHVKTVRVGPSGTEINDKPVPELHLLGADDKKLFGMLTGRDVRELQWMATLLRQALWSGQSTDAAASSPSETGPAPNKSASAASPLADINYDGMTIEERLRVAKLTDEFAAAIERDDRDGLLKLLARVHLPDAGAAAFADTVLAQSRQRRT